MTEDPAGEAPDHGGLLRPFLARRVRPRYDDLAPGSARRTALFNKLGHDYEAVLDWRYASLAPAGDLGRELRACGAKSRCYCLCAPPELDGHEVPLAEALARLQGQGLPVLLVCRPGALAYFEPEYERGAGRRYLLRRPPG